MASAPSMRTASQETASQPYIPAYVTVAEITIKGVVLGLFLAVVLGAANTYLGLKAGLTVSASIPAAVISMGVLRLFRKSTVLENNMVQTIASAGEAVAGGILFTIPALLILGVWTKVHYWETTLVAVVGGILGVLFTVPLRRALIVEENLAFPEGVATAQVIKAGEKGGSGVGYLVVGGALGALYKLLESGVNLWKETGLFVQKAGNAAFGVGMTLSPALMGVGYIIGLRVATLVFGGGVIGWLIVVPIYSALHPGLIQAGNLDAGATAIWRGQVRYIGVGAMLVGGMWSLIKLRKPLARAMGRGIRAGGKDAAAPLRTEQELSARTTFIGVAVLLIPMVAFYSYITQSWLVGFIMAAIMVVSGFLFSAVGAYMAGIVGSSNNPISGVTILTLIVAAFTLKLLGIGGDLGPAATIFVAAVIAVAGSIASDNLQDLKAGQILGSTPRKQQVMLVLGAVAAAFVLAPVLQILVNGATCPGGATGITCLNAPQANLMANIATGIFNPTTAGLPYGMVAIGAVLAVGLILTDLALARARIDFRIPVMAVAVGIYLPISTTAPIFLGGLVAWGVARRAKQKGQHLEEGSNMGVLFASGLIAGEALLGIVVSALVGGGIVFRDPNSVLLMAWPGILLLGYLAFVMGYAALRPGRQQP